MNNANRNSNKPITSFLSSADSGLSFSVATLFTFAVSLIYTIVVMVLATKKGMTATEYSDAMQGDYLFNVISYLLSALGLFAVIAFFGFYKKQPPLFITKTTANPKFWISALLMAFGLLFGFSELNNIFIGFLEKFGYAKPDMYIPNEHWYEVVTWVVLVGLFPAILEECVFRGYLLEGLKKFGTAFAVVVGGLLFSLFHKNPQQTPYQFICGMAYALLAIKSGSILPCIAMHFANNATILITNFFKVSFNQTTTIVLTVIGLISFIAGVVILLLSKTQKVNTEPNESHINHTKKGFFLFAFIGIAICALMWFSDLFAYIGG